MNGDKPIKAFKAGGVRASVFKNEQQTEGRTYPVYRAVLERTYQAQDGSWKSTNGYGGYDIAKAIVVLRKAFDFIVSADHDQNPSMSMSALPGSPESRGPGRVQEERIGE